LVAFLKGEGGEAMGRWARRIAEWFAQPVPAYYQQRQIKTAEPAAKASEGHADTERALWAGVVLGKADALREAYGRVLEEKGGLPIGESRLPASKEAIKAAIVLGAWFHRDSPGFRERGLARFQVAYASLACVQPDEVAERENLATRAFMQIGDTAGLADPARLSQLEKNEFLTELERILPNFLEGARALSGEEFGRLCDEFALRLAALDDPEKRPAEAERIRKALLVDSGGKP